VLSAVQAVWQVLDKTGDFTKKQPLGSFESFESLPQVRICNAPRWQAARRS